MDSRKRKAGRSWGFLGVLWLVFLSAALQAETLFVLDSGSDRATLEENARVLKALGVSPKIRKDPSSGAYQLTVGPLPDTEKSAALFFRLHREFPQAVAVPLGTKRTPTPSTVKASTAISETQEEGYRLWIALFALAVVGILALFVSSVKMQRLERHHEQIRQKHEEIERRFTELFRRLGENIYRLSKDLVHSTHSLSQEVEDRRVGAKLRQVVQAEKEVMHTTGNLLEFLRIKAHKVVITRERFSIDSMLDEVTETLMKEAGLARSDKEVVYFVDGRLPKYIVGDYVHIGEALGNLLQEALVYAAASEVNLSLKAYRSFTGGMELHGEIRYLPQNEEGPLEEYFTPAYDERINRYERLNRFVARELIGLMGGTAEVAKRPGGEILVQITLPVEAAQPDERRKYRLRSKEDTNKRVLVIQESYDASLAIKEMFAYFQHRVDVMEAERFEQYRPDLDGYDLLVIDEKLVSVMLVDYVRKLRRHHPLKVLGLRSLFSPERSDVEGFYDLRELRPLTMKRVFGVINELWVPPQERQESFAEEKQEAPRAPAPVRRLEEIPATPGVGLKSFGDFAGARVLIVEDNPINLKMMLRVLENAQITIDSAKNGQEAVDRVAGLDGEGYALVLMDINMPVMDGIAATKAIRELPQGKKVPIVALTALGLDTIRERLEQAGFDGYLPKPLNIGQLYTVLGRYLPRDPNRTVPEAEEARPEKIEGIDLEAALKRTQGDEMILKEILGAFLEGYGESDKKLRELYDAREYEKLKQLTLDLVGLSGSLEAHRLYEVAREMHRHMLQGRWEMVENDLIAYSEALARVRRGISRYLQS